jgi:hypothetical protein
MAQQQQAISDKSNLTVSLSYLVQIIGAICAVVYTYVSLTAEITSLENQVVLMKEDLKEVQKWTRDWESGGILPLDVSQNEKIDYLEKELDRLHEQMYGN